MNLRFYGFNALSQFKFFIEHSISHIQSSTSIDLVRHCFKFLSEFISSDLLLSAESTENTGKSKFGPISKKCEDLAQKLKLVKMVQEHIHNAQGFVY